MADPPAGDGHGTPRWVRVSVLIAALVILLVVIAMLTGVFGEHGPSRHRPAGDTPPASVSPVHILPKGGHG